MLTTTGISYIERTIMPKDLKFTDLKIILLGYQNNFVGILKLMSNAAKIFNI